tara:strand:+ start:209 stop:466 length:258 start_codon:yes stop_codon:yes gene_type:complete
MESKKKSPSTQYTFNHNLYSLLGDVLMQTLSTGTFNNQETESMIGNFIDLGVNIDFNNDYGLNLNTGPSSRGGRDFKAKLTKDIY